MNRKARAHKCKGEQFARCSHVLILENVRHHNEQDRRLILMRLAERRSFRQIGFATGRVSEGTAKRKFRKAVNELIKLIEWRKTKREKVKGKAEPLELES